MLGNATEECFVAASSYNLPQDMPPKHVSRTTYISYWRRKMQDREKRWEAKLEQVLETEYMLRRQLREADNYEARQAIQEQFELVEFQILNDQLSFNNVTDNLDE